MVDPHVGIYLVTLKTNRKRSRAFISAVEVVATGLFKEGVCKRFQKPKKPTLQCCCYRYLSVVWHENIGKKGQKYDKIRVYFRWHQTGEFKVLKVFTSIGGKIAAIDT